MFDNLSRETLPDQIAKQLMHYIVTQNLEPGDLLPAEIRLAEDFGVSRPVVREALRSLAAQGAINVVNGKGAIVRPVDDRLLQLFFQRSLDVGQGTLVELMEIRKPLEVQSAALAAQRRTPDEIPVIAQTVADMRANLQNLQIYAEHDVTFHLQIAAASHNKMLRHLIASIRALLKNVILEGLQRRTSAEQIEQIQGTHETIFAEIERGDAAAAAAAMALHFDEAVAALVGR